MNEHISPFRERWITDDNQQPGAGDGIPDDLGEFNSRAVPPLRAYGLDEQIELASNQKPNGGIMNFANHLLVAEYNFLGSVMDELGPEGFALNSGASIDVLKPCGKGISGVISLVYRGRMVAVVFRAAKSPYGESVLMTESPEYLWPSELAKAIRAHVQALR